MPINFQAIDIQALPQHFIVSVGFAVAVIVFVVIVWFLAQKPKPKKFFELNPAAGVLRLFPGAGIEVTLTAFRLVPGKKMWGFDALVKNHGEALEKLVLAFDGTKAVFANLPAGKLLIKPVELRRDRKKIGKMRVTIQSTPELEGLVREILVPVNEVLRELQGAGKISLIQETRGRRAEVNKARVREVIAKEFEEMLAARRAPEARPALAEPTPQALRERLAELAEEEKQAQLSFMKREINEAAFSDVMKKIQAARIEARARLARLEARKTP